MNIWIDDRDSAAFLVESFHYSKRFPTNVQLTMTWCLDGGLFGDRGDPVAAIVFTVPGTRWSENVFELARLIRTERCDVPLTGLIAEACSQLRRDRKTDLLVSFADQTQGHHGGIYQAASWNYDGQRDRSIDGLVISGRFIPGRVCNHRFGTRSPQLLKQRHPDWDIRPHFDEGKHLYWRALDKNGRKKADRLGLRSVPYVKPTGSASVCRPQIVTACR